MTENQKVQTAITQYIGKFLETHFGEQPDEVTVILQPPFLLIHLAGFLLPSEKMFVDKGEWKRVLETRNLMIQSLKDDLLAGLEKQLEQKVLELYADWNLAQQSGLLMAALKKDSFSEDFPWPEAVDQEALQEIILLNSQRTQKKPDQTNFYWLSDSILLVERIGILVDVEKKLIENGVIEELRLAKRPLEHRIIKLFNLESMLNGRVHEFFVDWDFQKDISFMVFLLDKRKS